MEWKSLGQDLNQWKQQLSQTVQDVIRGVNTLLGYQLRLLLDYGLGVSKFTKEEYG
jgi:hypothetical protein